jgi:lysyl-tRNA synthetase class 2
VKAVTAKKAAGANPYPHKFHVSISLPEYIEKYSSMEAGKQLTDVTVSLAGECGVTPGAW